MFKTLCRFFSGFGLWILICPASHAQKQAPPIIRKDRFGDPLPVGAFARLGTEGLTRARVQALSPDTKIVATANDRYIHLWDRVTGKKLRSLDFSNHSPRGLFFSPDSKQLAVVGFAGNPVALWDLQTFKKRTLRKYDDSAGGTDWSHCSVFSADGKVFTTASWYDVSQWDTTTGKLFRCFLYESKKDSFTHRVVAISPDGKTVAGEIQGAKSICLWDVPTGRLKYRLKFKEHCDCIRFSPDGRRFAVAGGFWTWTCLFATATGIEIRRCKIKGYGKSLAFSPDGKTIAIALENKCIQFLNWAAPDKPLRTFATPGIQSVAFSKDGKLLVWNCCSETTRFIDVATGKECNPIAGHRGPVHAVRFSPDGKRIATGSNEGNLRLWNAKTGEPQRVFQAHNARVSSVAFSADGQWLASGSWDHAANIWNLAKARKTRRLFNKYVKIHTVVFSPDQGTLIVGGGDALQLWQWRQDKKQLREDPSLDMALAPDGKTVVLADNYRIPRLQFLDLQSNKLRSESLKKRITSVAVAPNGKTLAVSCELKLFVMDVATGKIQRTLPGHINRSGDVAFSPDGRYLASVGDGCHNINNPNTMQIFEMLTGTEIHQFPRDVPVFSVAFSPDGNTLATGRMDTTTLLWDLKNLTGKKRATRLSPKQLAKCWRNLAQLQARPAYDAQADLWHAPQSALPFLAKHLKPVAAIDPKHVQKLIQTLDHRNFRQRTQATRELQQLAELANSALRKALKSKLTLEAHLRIQKLLDRLVPNPPAHRLRDLRAVAVLEKIGGSEARRILQRLAKGNSQALLTQAARRAVLRMSKSLS